jgi:hypothetical protein
MARYSDDRYRAVESPEMCPDADELEDALALLCRARDLIGPVAMRVRAEHRRQMTSKRNAARGGNPKAA